jgi:tRNA uridine 5-carboxymethylaminomethyl modification enzyme
VDDDRWGRFQERRSRFERNRAVIDTSRVNILGVKVPTPRALRQPEIRLETLVSEGQIRLEVDQDNPTLDLASLETDFKYEGYLRRQQTHVERQRRQEGRSIPATFEFAGVPGLSREMVQRLTELRPMTLGHASRIPGVTPAAVAVIATYLDRSSQRQSAEGDL